MCERVRKNTQGFRQFFFCSYIRFRFLSTALVLHALEDILFLFLFFFLLYIQGGDTSRHFPRNRDQEYTRRSVNRILCMPNFRKFGVDSTPLNEAPPGILLVSIPRKMSTYIPTVYGEEEKEEKEKENVF